MIDSSGKSFEYQIVQTRQDLNVTIKDAEMKKLFQFSSRTPMSSDLCNNETIALYHDKELTKLYKKPEENVTIELVNTYVNENYTS